MAGAGRGLGLGLPPAAQLSGRASLPSGSARPRAAGRGCSRSAQRSPRSWRGWASGRHQDGFRAESPNQRL